MRVESEKGRTAAYRMRRDDYVIGIPNKVREGLEKQRSQERRGEKRQERREETGSDLNVF